VFNLTFDVKTLHEEDTDNFKHRFHVSKMVSRLIVEGWYHSSYSVIDTTVLNPPYDLQALILVSRLIIGTRADIRVMLSCHR